MKKREIGIFGGTFDPIHNGHIHSVIATANHLAIEEVLLLPAHIPPHKNNVIADSKHRLAMAKLVCQHHPLFTCDDRELQRNRPSYTIDTLNEIKATYPLHTLYLFIGMDSLLSFTRWHRWQDILTHCHIVVSRRPNYCINQINDETQELLVKHQVKTVATLKSHRAGKIYLYDQTNFAISSTNIRDQLNEKANRLSDLPSYITHYIKEHQLYYSNK
ncbi:nicotinate-nucleotide adenylyltransferase [Thalassotalea profundi]|uniref:Probable nicotinate-nucleotide adenylyltransferase n=1 Tax=Thalassotalea profundi TaxID=2036687 RepID=A0ABQ3IG31_9GAMM|nr:nicotinate-nucleotide adenylyltransferase [Thalassotalea profundi]GHE80070.1 putative nicotinate-nucleotide adenylyltransferase [Thalassotalea profundi]